MIPDDDNWLMDDETDAATTQSDPWHVLVVDDEPDIHHVTRLALTNIVGITMYGSSDTGHAR